jgi:hypothetical protein
LRHRFNCVAFLSCCADVAVADVVTVDVVTVDVAAVDVAAVDTHGRVYLQPDNRPDNKSAAIIKIKKIKYDTAK